MDRSAVVFHSPPQGASPDSASARSPDSQSWLLRRGTDAKSFVPARQMALDMARAAGDPRGEPDADPLADALERRLPAPWGPGTGRFESTLAILRDPGPGLEPVTPEELNTLVRTGQIRDALRNLVKYDLIYALGFNLASYVSGRWGEEVAPHLAKDSQLAKDFGAILGFLSGTSTIGFGAEVGITIVEEGGLGPKYGAAYAVDKKGRIERDSQGVPVPYAKGRYGSLSEKYLKFWPFSITHTYIATMLSHLPPGELARAYMPAGAVAASVTSLHETLAPFFSGKVVPAWLDGERDGGDFMRKCIADLRQSSGRAVGGYMWDFGAGVLNSPRVASYKGVMRGMFRFGCASVALCGRLAAGLTQSPQAKLGLNIANNVVLGPVWTWLVRVPGEAVAAIQDSGRPAEPKPVASVVPPAARPQPDHGEAQQGAGHTPVLSAPRPATLGIFVDMSSGGERHGSGVRPHASDGAPA